MKIAGTVVAAITILSAPPTACALCSYRGQDNAKTTVSQEFGDAKWVVKAKVLSATDHWSDAEDSWTSYDLEVTHAFKGKPAKRLHFFTFRDSGGFYMDRPWIPLPAGHDIGGEYLLFLNPVEPVRGLPALATGAVFVNYACGQSGPWMDVPPSSKSTLASLERAR